jgi:hypothetical protein
MLSRPPSSPAIAILKPTPSAPTLGTIHRETCPCPSTARFQPRARRAARGSPCDLRGPGGRSGGVRISTSEDRIRANETSSRPGLLTWVNADYGLTRAFADCAAVILSDRSGSGMSSWTIGACPSRDWRCFWSISQRSKMCASPGGSASLFIGGGPGATLAFSAVQVNRRRIGPPSAPSCLRPHVP